MTNEQQNHNPNDPTPGNTPAPEVAAAHNDGWVDESADADIIYDKPTADGKHGALWRFKMRSGQIIYGIGEKDGKNIVVPTQEGTLLEKGPNGFMVEQLVAAGIDRLQMFQEGQFPCAENDEALYHFRLGLAALDRRAKTRIAQGVEGKHEAHVSQPQDQSAAMRESTEAGLTDKEKNVRGKIREALEAAKGLSIGRLRSMIITRLKEVGLLTDEFANTQWFSRTDTGKNEIDEVEQQRES